MPNQENVSDGGNIRGNKKTYGNLELTWSISTAFAILAKAFLCATWNQWSINFLNQT